MASFTPNELSSDLLSAFAAPKLGASISRGAGSLRAASIGFTSCAAAGFGFGSGFGSGFRSGSETMEGLSGRLAAGRVLTGAAGSVFGVSAAFSAGRAGGTDAFFAPDSAGVRQEVRGAGLPPGWFSGFGSAAALELDTVDASGEG